jgi:hypothetical protein
MDRNEGRRHVLGMRVCENASRFATDVAGGRGSPTVDVEHITRHLTACPLSGVRTRPSINQADYHRGCFASYARPSRPKNDQDPEPGIE